MQIQKGRYYRNHWLQHVGNIIGERVTAKFIRALLTSRTDERSKGPALSPYRAFVLFEYNHPADPIAMLGPTAASAGDPGRHGSR